MTDLIIWLLLGIILIEGAYIWTLRDQREQLKGGMNRLNRENADLARSLKVTRSRLTPRSIIEPQRGWNNG